jgi:hypothetical protein
MKNNFSIPVFFRRFVGNPPNFLVKDSLCKFLQEML